MRAFAGAGFDGGNRELGRKGGRGAGEERMSGRKWSSRGVRGGGREDRWNPAGSGAADGGGRDERKGRSVEEMNGR